MRIGIHASSAGSPEKTAARAAAIGANTYQIFSASPRMWNLASVTLAPARALTQLRRELDLTPFVIHDNYLINLAAPAGDIRSKSIAAFRGELDRALALEADYLVAHPGSYKSQSVEEGIDAFVAGLVEAGQGIRSRRLTLLLENTAGSGAAIGRRFEELALIREKARRLVQFPIGYCLDTAHCLAAGYDVATAAGLRQTLAEAERVLGLDRVPVIHTNDSKAPLGKRVDRHEHIGKGYIGVEGFRRIVNHPLLRDKAFILETPIEQEGDDRRNIEFLKSLCRRKSTTTAKSS